MILIQTKWVFLAYVIDLEKISVNIRVHLNFLEKTEKVITVDVIACGVRIIYNFLVNSNVR